MENRATVIRVGIMSGGQLGFSLDGLYTDSAGRAFKGEWAASLIEGNIILKSGEREINTGREVTLHPADYGKSHFILHSVIIGVAFHWQREEDQTFRGDLKFIIEGDRLTAVNILPVEDYLCSVISSEMSATSSMELLKAHAVVSRSWLLAQMEKSKRLRNTERQYETSLVTTGEIIRWYDREDHENFDVCADDHCQRYQGITRATTATVETAVGETSGEVLTYENSICDARYSKSCGGISELFENAWEPEEHPYLAKVIDNDKLPSGFKTDLTVEKNAVSWISGKPEAFCNTGDREILSQVLNSYDQETTDFYRWSVTYSQKEVTELIHRRTGIDFGPVTDLEPVLRGVSGRLIKLRITGENKSLIIGKELEIRKALSPSHLYSSAFFVEKSTRGEEIIFTLHGAGWGHGVGLCQIGAAVMGARGYSYRSILSHYFTGIELRKIY